MRGPQFAEFVGRVAAGEQVERGVVCAPGERGEGGASAHGVEPHVDVDGLERDGGDGLLGEDVERVGRDPQRFDQPCRHPFGCDSRVDEVGPVFRVHDSARDFADLVSRATDALESARDRGWRFDLHDEVDRAHVDAEFETGRRDDTAQPARLEVVFDERPLLLADGAVVGACEDERIGIRAGERRTFRLAGCSDQLCGRPRGCGGTGIGCATAGRNEIGSAPEQAFFVDLVEARGQAFGESTRVGEHDGRPMLEHAIDDGLFDVRPDRPGLRSARVAFVIPGGGAQFAHVFDRYHDPQVEPFAGWGRNDLDGRPASEEPRDLLRGAHGRRQADPLRGRGEHGVEPFE